MDRCTQGTEGTADRTVRLYRRLAPVAKLQKEHPSGHAAQPTFVSVYPQRIGA